MQTRKGDTTDVCHDVCTIVKFFALLSSVNMMGDNADCCLRQLHCSVSMEAMVCHV